MQPRHSINLSQMPSQDELKKLEKEWYTKLEDSGFDDIERTTHPDRPLRVWHGLNWRHLTEDKLNETRDYISKAEELLETHSFENETHKTIWELHTKGLSKRKIEKALKETQTPLKRERIGTIIKDLSTLIKDPS